MQNGDERNLEPSAEVQFDLSGGALCLDFVNTLGDRPRNQSEHLHNYGDLLAWSRQTEILDDSAVTRLSRLARKKPSAARSVFMGAREVRETLYRVIAAFAEGETAAARDFAALNRLIAKIMRRSELVPTDCGFQLARKGGADALDQMLWPVLRSTLDLLTSERVQDVRQCAGQTCSWLFIDNSRTRRKKWCDMKVCGNRAKARRHYEKTKALQEG